MSYEFFFICTDNISCVYKKRPSNWLLSFENTMKTSDVEMFFALYNGYKMKYV